MYHNKHAAIIVEHANHSTSQKAIQAISLSHPELSATIVDDLRQILQNERQHTHTQRIPIHNQPHNQLANSRETTEPMETNHNYTYRLRNVPGSINLSMIRSHLSYYGPVADLQEVDYLPLTHREVLCTFASSANLRLLEHIWAVNIQGYNISIANAQFSAQQLDYRKHYVVGFRGFHYQTTESQALRLLRPYGGMTCYFHQNLAYIGFKTYDQMIAACQLRLYTDDDRLLTGRPRIAYLPSGSEANGSLSDA